METFASPPPLSTPSFVDEEPLPYKQKRAHGGCTYLAQHPKTMSRGHTSQNRPLLDNTKKTEASYSLYIHRLISFYRSIFPTTVRMYELEASSTPSRASQSAALGVRFVLMSLRSPLTNAFVFAIVALAHDRGVR